MGYVPEKCRAKNTSIKLPWCIKFAFQIISEVAYVSKNLRKEDYGISFNEDI